REVHPQERVGALLRDQPGELVQRRPGPRLRADQHLPAGLDVEAALDQQLRVRGDARIYTSHLPFSWTTSPSSSIRPPSRSSLTRSQWIALRFWPPTNARPAPIARWTVPSIFSSKSVFRVCRWIPGLQPIPSSPRRRAPSSVSSAASRNSSFPVADASTTSPASKRSRTPSQTFPW